MMDVDRALRADLPLMPMLPHHIIPVNEEFEDLPLPLDVPFMNQIPAWQNAEIDDILFLAPPPPPPPPPPLPVYGPSQILLVTMSTTWLPSDWKVYSGMNYFVLEEEIPDEEMELEEDEIIEDEEMDEDEEMEEDAEMKDKEDRDEEETVEGCTNRPISTTKLEDMIRFTAGGERYIATMDLQEVNTTQVFAPTLEPHFIHQ